MSFSLSGNVNTDCPSRKVDLYYSSVDLGLRLVYTVHVYWRQVLEVT